MYMLGLMLDYSRGCQSPRLFRYMALVWFIVMLLMLLGWLTVMLWLGSFAVGWYILSWLMRDLCSSEKSVAWSSSLSQIPNYFVCSI